MRLINPVSALLWTLRRSERDVAGMYEALSPIMQAATGGDMLNFGLWDGGARTPAAAQENLCRRLAGVARLDSARVIIDAGSGLGAPAAYWMREFPGATMLCLNTAYSQLRDGGHAGASPVNASATLMPVATGSADRVLALESPQHFRPLESFARESARVLSDSGVLAAAVPVAAPGARLGLLGLAWASEHYTAGRVRRALEGAGLGIEHEESVGEAVYPPLARYYAENRAVLGPAIAGAYSGALERTVAGSIGRMGRASEAGLIDYLLLRARPSEA